MSKTIVLSAVAGAAAAPAVVAVAQPGPPPYYGGGEPVLNVDPELHGNLAAAQRSVRQAFDSITAAQQDNNYHLGGYAGRAKELLREANEQIKFAAQTANRR